MLNLSELLTAYPVELRVHRSFILREYLQCKILEILFDGPFGNRFCFLGGTCLRLVHQNSRFSEDLDFDNFQVTESEFDEVSKAIQLGLTQQGFQVEMKQIIRGAYHCYIRFPGLLFQQGLSGYREEKILIQLDTEAQGYEFIPEQYFLNKFDVFSTLNIAPLPLLLAQKFYAILNRRRNKGRDFFDVVYLLSFNVTPDYNFLNLKTGISDSTLLKERIIDHCQSLDMNAMAKDVEPFLFQSFDTKKVIHFEKFIEQQSL
jgi:predicted nucleotidyltransferase component of viral defense system